MGGKVVLVGAGPGDPGLITVKGLSALRAADVVVYDRLVPAELIKDVKPGCELIYVGKSPGRHELGQDEIQRLLVDRARRGLLVVRLKGGDPYTFGRGEEECEYVLSQGVDCEVVPGVPSYVGAAAYAGIPLAGRVYGSIMVLATGHVAGSEAELERYLGRLTEASRFADNVVVLMGASTAGRVLRAIMAAKGPGAPAAAVMNATTPGQVTITGSISDLIASSERGEIRNPAVIVVGRSVLARGRLWRADAGRST